MNIQAQKAILIEQFKQVEDIEKLVLDRFEKIRKNTERLLDWAKSKIY